MLAPFNGATPFQAWRLPFPSIISAATPMPSMEPRPFRRGDATGGVDGEPAISAFNGATPFQAWRHKSHEMALWPLLTLQWSHALSGVETGTP